MLPSSGHYKSTVAMDPEWARRLIELQGDGAETPSMTPQGFTLEVTLLTLIADRLELLRGTLIGVNSEDGATPPFEPLPRPVTAVDTARERSVLEQLLDVDREIRGGAA